MDGYDVYQDLRYLLCGRLSVARPLPILAPTSERFRLFKRSFLTIFRRNARNALSATSQLLRIYGEGKMTPVGVSVISFGFMFGGSLLGMALRAALPNDHLKDDSRDVMKLATGMIGTMAALVLGLLVASGKGSYDAQSAELTQISANIVLLDRMLAVYGPDANTARETLRKSANGVLERTFGQSVDGSSRLDPGVPPSNNIYVQIQSLPVSTDLQRSIQSHALNVALNLGQTRYLMYEQATTPVSKVLLGTLICWLTITFVIWGALGKANPTLIGTLLVSAFSAATAIMLILELYSPYEGLIRVSDAPLRAALAHLGQ
jgi:hypothetical protein